MLNIFKPAIIDTIVNNYIREKQTTPTEANCYAKVEYYWLDEEDNFVDSYFDKGLAIECCKRWLLTDDEDNN